MTKLHNAQLSKAAMELAWRRRDAGYDGLFFVAVKTTRIFCRPSCPSQPKPNHLEFFRTAAEALGAGYRPCKRCEPELANGSPPDWVTKLMKAVSPANGDMPKPDFRALGTTPERARRWFQKHYGMTFAAWRRGHRLARAFTQIQNGQGLDDVILGNGFQSHSGFRDAFSRTFGRPPGKARQGDCLSVALLETPLGPMLAAASSEGVCQLEFADRRGLQRSYEEMRRRFGLAVVPGENGIVMKLKEELAKWFDGKLRQFTVPMVARGTPFQELVWRELQRIPYGRTVSYEEIARRIGRARAVRAVARANGANRLYLLVPCHRVIGKDGRLSGYGGGVWRKRLLLDLEQRADRPTAAARATRPTPGLLKSLPATAPACP